MITNFVLNTNNVLSTFGTRPHNDRAVKYVKQQDTIVNTFNTIIRDNVLRYFVGVKPQKNKATKLNLPIKNALWYLWNSAYKLGTTNATSELSNRKFNAANNLVEFAKKKSYEEEQQERLLEAEQELESRQQNKSDDYNLFTPKIETKNKKNNSKIQIIKTDQKQIELDNKINNAVKNTEVIAEKISTGKVKVINNNNEVAQIKIELADTIRQKEIFEKNYVTDNGEDEPKIAYNKFVSLTARKQTGNPDIKVKANDADKEIINTKYRNLRIKKLTLEKRITELELDDKLKGMTESEQKKEKENKIPRKLTESTIERNEAIKDISKRNKEEESRTPQDVQYSEFGKVYVDKRLDAVATNLDDYYRDDLKEIIPKYLNSKSPTKDKELYNDINTKLFGGDENYNTKRIALTELAHAYNLGRLDYYLQKGIKKVKWNLNIEHVRRKVVCTVCELRTQKDNGYGNGIYTLDEAMNNPQLFPAIHPYCFTEDTEILLEDNKKKKIKDITIDDYVVTGVKNTKSQKVREVMTRQYSGNIIKLTLSNGTTINTTPEHPFWGGDKFYPAKIFQIGDFLYQLEGVGDFIQKIQRYLPRQKDCGYRKEEVSIPEGGFKKLTPIRITKIELYKYNGYVYNFSVEKDETYIAENILVHNCACYLSPIREDDKNKVDSTNTKLSSLFDNNVSKWAAGGTTAILGTALMYSMFRRTRGRVIVPNIITPVAKKVVSEISSHLKPNIKNVKDITTSNNLADVIIDNTSTILKQLPEVLQQASEYLIELPMLNLTLPEVDVVEVVKQQYLPQVTAAINKTIPNTNFSYNDYLDTVTNNAQKTITVANEVNPNSVNSIVQVKLDNINKRLPGYESYTPSTFDTTVSKIVINSYSDDVNFINNTLTSLEDNNSKLYAEIRGLIKVRDEAIEVIKPTLSNLPDNITPQDVISTHPTITKLNNTLVDLSNSLAANKQRLNSDDLHGQLVSTKQAILSNPALAQDYIRYNSKKITSIFKSLGSSDPAFVYNVDSQLNTLSSKLVKSDSLTKNEFLLSLDELEQVYKKVNKEKIKVNSITQIDLQEFMYSKQSTDNLIKAAGILDYKKGIDTLENKILYITTLLLNKYK